jgi:hypothetical protein
VTLSFDAWKVGRVNPTTLEVPLRTGDKKRAAGKE